MDAGLTMAAESQLVVVGAGLFALGLVGFLTRRNLIVMFLSTEVMFQGVLVNLVAMGHIHGRLDGQVFALFLLVIAAVEAGLALGLIVLLFRRRGTVGADAWATMQG
jgi:NADH-quinone oxidoreductase subunit K